MREPFSRANDRRPPRGLGGYPERKTLRAFLFGGGMHFEKGKGVFLSGFCPR